MRTDKTGSLGTM